MNAMTAFEDLTGMKFGRLTTRRRADRKGRVHWDCDCDCGGTSNVGAGMLKSGNTRSCGCLQKEIIARIARNQTNGRLTHGEGSYGRRTPEYGAWIGMLQRCYNPRTARYNRYGGRGIVVCEHWREAYENFLADMGRRPAAGYSIDRIDNDGNYEPGNCRWASRVVQVRNSTRCKLVTVNGVSMTPSEWAEHLGCSLPSLWSRAKRRNGDFAAAILSIKT